MEWLVSTEAVIRHLVVSDEASALRTGRVLLEVHSDCPHLLVLMGRVSPRSPLAQHSDDIGKMLARAYEVDREHLPTWLALAQYNRAIGRDAQGREWADRYLERSNELRRGSRVSPGTE